MDQQLRHETGQRVTQLAEEWAAAERHGDTACMERILSDDFVAVGPRGYILSKAEWLQRFVSGDLKHDTFNLDEVAVRVFDDAAVLIGRETETGRYRETPIQGQFRATLIFVHQQEHWLLAGVHLSPIAPVA